MWTILENNFVFNNFVEQLHKIVTCLTSKEREIKRGDVTFCLMLIWK